MCPSNDMSEVEKNILRKAQSLVEGELTYRETLAARIYLISLDLSQEEATRLAKSDDCFDLADRFIFTLLRKRGENIPEDNANA